jgi:hypothetical protein
MTELPVPKPSYHGRGKPPPPDHGGGKPPLPNHGGRKPPPPDHGGGNPPLPVDIGDTPVSVYARVVADGFDTLDKSGLARATLVLRPTVIPGLGAAAATHMVNLRRWPTEVMARYFPRTDGLPHGSWTDIRILPVFGLTGKDDQGRVEKLIGRFQPEEMTLKAKLMWTVKPDTTTRIEDFWRRAMSPAEDGDKVIWDIMLEALRCVSDHATSVILPRPHQAASLAFTFERGRMLLDALAGPEAPLASRTKQQQVALNRPWYRGDRRTQLASIDQETLLPTWGQSPEDEEYWIAPYRRRTAALIAGEKPEPIWPHAKVFADAAVADGSAAACLKEQICAAHHATTPANPRHLVCTTEDLRLDMARRRLGALLGLPSLQRLFGFAADVFFENKELAKKVKTLKEAVGDNSPFVLISSTGPGATWALARYQPAGADACFCPASWAELRSEPAATMFGLRNLGGNGYDIVTVEPVLATEASINHAAKGDAKGSALSPADRGTPVLHNGGLRVVQIRDDDHDPAPAGAACITENTVQDATELKVGDRLMIGIRTGEEFTHTLWRSPDYRGIQFCDPGETEPEGWVEKELERRIGPANQPRRLELDGAMAMPAQQQLVDDSPISDNATDKDPVQKRALKIIADSTLALWGSDPGGVPPGGVNRKGEFQSEHTVSVIEELDVTRIFSAPSKKKEHAAELLNPSLRFGWPYYAVLAQVFEGGGCANTYQTANVVAGNPSLAFPDLRQNGRRFLRHERVNAPMVLVLDSDFVLLNGLKPPQRGPDMYVRTLADKKLNPSQSRRLFAPPPVPLQFAMLHDVLRKLQTHGGVPQPGLKGISLLGKDDDGKPSRARVGSAIASERNSSLYYPDPAASVLVLGLKLPSEKDTLTTSFVEGPIAIPFGARTWPDRDSGPATRTWPDVVPVLVEVRAVEKATKGSRIGKPSMKWLGPQEKLSDKQAPGAVPVAAVEIQLGRGEDLLLQAWCVPTVNQLADWFDAVEAAGVLATNEGPTKGDPDAACFIGLKNLLGKEFPAPDSERAATAACVGAGGMRAPSRPSLVTLAGLVHRELLLRPISALTSPLPIRLTHAIDDALLPAPVLGPALVVTRRLFPGKIAAEKAKATDTGIAGLQPDDKPPVDKPKAADAAAPGSELVDESPADFVNNVQISDWGLSSTEQGATVTLIGGEIGFDPASTSGLVIEAHCAAPFGEPLDPETGRPPSDRLANKWETIDSKGATKPIDPDDVKTFGFLVRKDRSVEFVRKNVVALKFDGLPLPKDGSAGLQKFQLTELMAGAWGEQRQFGDALRAALPAAFQSPGARQLWLRAVPVNRHAGFFLPPKDANGKVVEKPPQAPWCPPPGPPQLFLPATTRPSPPVIDHVSVALSLQKMPPRIGMDGAFTVGVEQVNSLVIWHSRPFFSSGEGEMLALVCWPPGLFARGVTRDEQGRDWFQVDPLTGEGPEFYDDDLGPGGGYVTRWGADPLVGNDVSVSRFPTGPLFDPARLSDDGLRVSRAFMPIPVAGNDWATDAAGETKDAKGAKDAKGPKITEAKPPETDPPNAFLAVALNAFEPKFDPVEELWYVNLTIRTDPLPFPRVRLGLVRYQPHAREDDTPQEGSEPVRLRVSTPTTEWVKPLPGRKATATCRRRADGNTEVVVVVNGPAALPEGNQSVTQEMLVEVIRYRKDGASAQEYLANEIDGTLASCCNWSTSPQDRLARGLLQEVQGGLSWSCMFVLADTAEANGWSHAVTVKETRKIPKASDNSIGDTGPNFLARIELKVST